MEGKQKYKKIGLLLAIIVIGYISMYISSIDKFWENGQEDTNTAIEDAIRKSALECYALEGSFPPSVDYLKKNYGLIVNEDAYFYHYQVTASNMIPDIKVVKRWSNE
ncbi:hypothetical protein HMPREF9630_00307 [Peptoanaerobacter stomatis]|jgi:hypothetical protein|uniref:Uncharacterized protein n=1 Tax=Peptoanaerobacter stomatis TaxID=796937 RepID=G9WYG8_9FIRM|nr:hypothetical protein [Peptoanaerobacter stomatis]NWO25712.1 hypothetical protein [Peptostreptococcaceae bacterium oral taxon 081]EHL16379.1 hypothetical protein HMPREF9629_01219 [Peptoanaerobacter stomatis]EHL18582.1 hypothetical protein HMPREF9630_00307 [Peptoanaerobacter stomatis]EHL19621.1 hypothetical protein HMPREF9628_01433 [Peptoanaerobacter stomatis]EJU23842.1 hypothetical protein HMPREF1143_1015 [Peptoanaerobacter stomatis]